MASKQEKPGAKKKTGRPRLPRDEEGNIIREKGPEERVSAKKRKERDAVEYQCCCCGQIYDEQQFNFLTTSSPMFNANGGYLPFCTECLVKYYSNIVLPAVDGDIARAIEVLCGICDWYWHDDIMSVVEKINAGYIAQGSDIPPFITYSQRRNMTQHKKLGTTYLDTVRQRWNDSRAIKSIDDLNTDPNDPHLRREAVAAEDVWFFGPGYTPEQYRYLREQYTDWCERYDCQSKAQEEIFKSLAIAQLNVQIAQQEGNQKKTTEAMKTLQELMDTAKIKPKQKTDAALVEQNTFGTLIQKWENEEPIPEPREEWKDVDKIKKYVGAYFLGHLCKVFDIDNEWSQLYEEEISAHTVQPPRYEQSDESTSAFDDKFKEMRGVRRGEEMGGDA